jgi:bifunctional non-homologous end joining protein LigD
MLATLVPEAFHRAGWVYEEKYNGERILAYKEGADVRLLSRNAKDYTARFADIAAAIAGMSARRSPSRNGPATGSFASRSF